MIGNHHVCWENQRTKWSFSIVTFVYPEAKAGGNTWLGLKPFGIYSNIELLEANMIINQSTIRLLREMYSQCIGQVANSVGMGAQSLVYSAVEKLSIS